MDRWKNRNPALLVTPEGVPLSFEPADLGARIFAFILDSLIILSCVFLVFLVLGTLAEFWTLTLLALFFFRQGYFFFFELAWNGLTPGKRSARIRVVDRGGGALTMEGLLARNLMRDLEVFLPLAVLLFPARTVGQVSPLVVYLAFSWVFLVAALPLITRKRLRAGDILGGTMVVSLPGVALLEDPAGRKRKAGIHFSREQLEVYGEKELEVLADILRSIARHEPFPQDLALLAETIARKVGYHGAEPRESPRAFLEAFYAAQRRRLEEKLLFGRRKASKEDKGMGPEKG